MLFQDFWIFFTLCDFSVCVDILPYYLQKHWKLKLVIAVSKNFNFIQIFGYITFWKYSNLLVMISQRLENIIWDILI